MTRVTVAIHCQSNAHLRIASRKPLTSIALNGKPFPSVYKSFVEHETRDEKWNSLAARRSMLAVTSIIDREVPFYVPSKAL